MSDFYEEWINILLRELVKGVNPGNALPKIWARIRRHRMGKFQAIFKRHYPASPFTSLTVLFESGRASEDAERYIKRWGADNLPGMFLDEFIEF